MTSRIRQQIPITKYWLLTYEGVPGNATFILDTIINIWIAKLLERRICAAYAKRTLKNFDELCEAISELIGDLNNHLKIKNSNFKAEVSFPTIICSGSIATGFSAKNCHE